MLPIHPDDVLLFKEVSDAMRRVAKSYDLPLKSITPFPMPKAGMADCMGDCSYNGHIRLVMRCTVDGVWVDAPRTPDLVWRTAAHELSHLRHFNHGEAFRTFYEELLFAMNNQKPDHRQKVLDKLIKLQASRQSEAELGNSEAAEAFASMINKMMLDYELNPTDIDYARATDHDPIVEIRSQFNEHGIKATKTRSAWQETLAQSVANAHLCKILIRPGSNQIWFVGTKSHATVAEYVYGTMVPFVGKASKKAEIDYWRATGGGRGIYNQAKGYRASWIDGFITRLWQRFAEARRQAAAEAAARSGGSTETGLMRLDGALIKVQRYIDDKFSSRAAHRYASNLSGRSCDHSEGRAAGRAAADQVPLGRRGLNSGTPPKLIGE